MGYVLDPREAEPICIIPWMASKKLTQDGIKTMISGFVTIDGIPQGEMIAAFIPAQRWNGFVMPLFLAKDVEKVMRLLFGDDAVTRVGNCYVMPDANDGDPTWDDAAVDAGFDGDGMAYRAALVSGIADIASASENANIVLAPRQIAVNGEPYTVYDIGDSWCWNEVRGDNDHEINDED